MEWQFDSNMPIYTQLVDKIKLAIVSGAYTRGQRLSAVREPQHHAARLSGA